ncbi:MAG: glucose-1-phosphate cytidylyltransferase [Coriobacteriia bacterium]|nr:glucose-1-phosphate cytidylyltransferase [Coriobacteriia bacterium]
MKAVILAGGLGTRLSEETDLKPKPMAEIGEHPILWHILKLYSHFGVTDFVICVGYKGYQIKEYFNNYWLHNCDVTFNMRTRATEVHQDASEPWRVTVVDTGAETPTGGRIRQIRDYVGDETFLLTYGDGVADVDVSASIDYHRQHGKLATVTAVQPIGRFGAMDLTREQAVLSFQEKPKGDGGWVNGGFFVLEPGIFEYLGDGDTMWEQAPLEEIAAAGELVAYKHTGFWQPMDTLRDKRLLEELWRSGEAPWKVW